MFFISDRLGHNLDRNCAKILLSLGMDTQFCMMRRGIPKATDTVRFFQTLFFGHAIGSDVPKNVVGRINQLPL